jgi:hypothetical protein
MGQSAARLRSFLSVTLLGHQHSHDGNLKSKNQNNVRGQDNADHDHNAGAKTQLVDELAHEAPRLALSVSCH